MAGQHALSSDKGLGISLTFGVLSLVGALLMMLGPETANAGIGFAAAILFGGLAVVSFHLYQP